jgi:acyl dehydratase
MTHARISLADLARHVGEEMGASSWVTLDQAKIQEFAHCTGDHQWIHVDPERAARESPFGGTIAHGFLTMSLIAPTAFELLVPLVHVKSVVNYALPKFRFINPVRSARAQPHQARRRQPRARIATGDDHNTMEIEGQIRPALTASALAIFLGP